MTSSTDKCLVCGEMDYLNSLRRDHAVNDKVENYAQMICDCFNISFVASIDNEQSNICDICVCSLRYCHNFYQRVLLSYRNMCDMKTVQYESNDYAKLSCDTSQVFTFEDSTEEHNEIVENDIDNWSVTSEEIKLATGHKELIKGEKNTLDKLNMVPLDPSILECPICSISFDSHLLLLPHYNSHYPKYLCDFCGKSYSSKPPFVVHVRGHSDNRLKCSLCDRLYKTSSSLLSHKKTYHEKRKLHKCRVCSEAFDCSVTKKRHMLSQHGIQYPTYPCTTCNRTFITAAIMRNHMRVSHLKQSKHSCGICFKQYPVRGLLEDHMSRHAGVNRHNCQICGKALATRKTLRLHLKTHQRTKLT